MKTYKKSILLIGITFILSFILLLTVRSAQAQKSFYWERWDIDMTLLENGDVRVEETQTLNFSGGTFTFGFRTIPIGSSGNNSGITDVSVREGDIQYTQVSSNAPRTFKIESTGNNDTIRWYFEPTQGSHTYTFSYTVKGAVIVGTLEEGDGDQIFWTVIPDDHPAAVRNSQIIIRLPKNVAAQQYTGTTDYLVQAYIDDVQRENVDISVGNDGSLITYRTTSELAANQELNVRVQFPHGLLDIPKPDWQAQQQQGDTISTIVAAIALLLCVTGPLGVLTLWYTRGRDPELGIVVPEFITEPPDDLPPAVVGTIVDEKADMQDIISTLVDLARRGYLTMEEKKVHHYFHRVDRSTEGLSKFEAEFLKSVFGQTQTRKLKDLQYKFTNKLPNLRKELYTELVDRELVPKSPESVRNTYYMLGGLMLGLSVLLFFGLASTLGDFVATAVCPSIALALTGITLLITARFMPKKTVHGAETAAKWLAFKEYLKNIEDYRDLESAEEIFEQYLAYAIAFGLERSWIRKFSNVPNTPIPPWYAPYPHRAGYGGRRGGIFGGRGRSYPSKRGTSTAKIPNTPSLEGASKGLTGGLAGMSAGLTRMLNSTATTFKSTPPSSSSGGSSGGFSGGFSGGSSGGGGSAGFG